MSHQQKLFPQKSEQEEEEGEEGEEEEHETCTNLKGPPPYGRGLIMVDSSMKRCMGLCKSHDDLIHNYMYQVFKANHG